MTTDKKTILMQLKSKDDKFYAEAAKIFDLLGEWKDSEPVTISGKMWDKLKESNLNTKTKPSNI